MAPPVGPVAAPFPIASTVALQTAVNPFDDPVTAVARAAGLTLLSLAVSAAAALGYRWYTREQIPPGLATLLGLATVALYLNTVGLFGDIVGGGGSGPLFELQTVVFNVAVLLAAAAATPVGRVGGDRLATDVFAVAGARELDAEVSRVVRSVGRVTAIELPTEIDDVDGFDRVPDDRKAAMSGKTLLFPRRLSADERKERLVDRLQTDYGIGRVDVELSDDGSVEYLAVGSRASGLGPTLASGSAAVAVRGDPASGASPGDVVQVWETEPELRRVVTAELRAATDEVATVAVDATDAARLDANSSYRLVTLPAEPRVDREFVSLLRAAQATFTMVTVTSKSPLVGRTVGDLGATVVAVRPAGGAVEAIPRRSRSLDVGDAVYVLAGAKALRALERAATADVAEDEDEAGRDGGTDGDDAEPEGNSDDHAGRNSGGGGGPGAQSS